MDKQKVGWTRGWKKKWPAATPMISQPGAPVSKLMSGVATSHQSPWVDHVACPDVTEEQAPFRFQALY